MKRFALLFVLILTCSLFWTGCGGKDKSAGTPDNDRAPGGAKETEKRSDVKDGEKKSDSKEDKASSQRAEASESKEGGKGSVEVSAAAQRRMGLVVAPVEMTSLADVLTLTGAVQAIDSRMSHVRPLARGRVTEVLVRLGDQVRAAQALATFDNIEAGDLASQFNTAQAELARLHIQQANTTRQAERMRNLAAIGAVPQKELEAIEAERQGQQEAIRAQESTVAGLAARLRRFGVTEPTATTSSTTSLQAPFAGVVTAVQVAPGDVVDTNSDLFSIADLSRVYVAGQVYEKDLGRVQVGQAASITVAAFPNLRFPGRVASISALLDPQTRTTAVRVEVTNSGERLRLDMFANVELPTATRHTALAVPADAIQQVESRQVVFVRQDPTHFIARTVQLGDSIGRLTEIREGLTAGQPVVVKGAFRVKSAMLGGALGEENEK